MTVLLQIGIRYPPEMSSGIGHVACTLGGVNYESRGGKGCLKGKAARGATNPLFRHQFFLALTDQQAILAKQYADSCVGQPYVWGGVPTPHHGGDCSGYVSAIICAALGQPARHLFYTGSWADTYQGLGFQPGLGGAPSPKAHPVTPPPNPEDDMPLTDADVHKTWEQDGIIDNRAWRADVHTNPKIKPSSAVEISMDEAHAANIKADQILAALAAAAKVNAATLAAIQALSKAADVDTDSVIKAVNEVGSAESEAIAALRGEIAALQAKLDAVTAGGAAVGGVSATGGGG